MLSNFGLADTITFFLLLPCILLAFVGGIYYFFRKGSGKAANVFFGSLLWTLAFTLLHQMFVLLDVFLTSPEWLFLPIYFTLSFGPLLFFAVKFRLYPNYRFDKSDWKHAILPVGQWLYFLILFFQNTEFKVAMGRQFFSPFYGGAEMLLYVGTFYAYLYSAYRYIRYKYAKLRHSGKVSELKIVLRQKRMVKVLIILFWFNSAYIGGDFIMYELLGFNLHDLRGFTRLGDLSFAAIAFWIAWCGWKNATTLSPK